MDTIGRDIGYAVRAMRRAPGFTATALLAYAVGIGVTTAVFSIVYGILLRPLPYPESDRLVRIWEEHPGGVSPAGNRWLSSHTYAAWRGQPHALESIGGYSLKEYSVVLDNEPVKTFGSEVSPAVFGMLGATPASGRFFKPDEDVEGVNHVVVLSHTLWRDRYGGGSDVVGMSLMIDGTPYTIVGVARPGLHFPDSRVLLWIPYVIPREAPPSARTVVFTALGRLETRVTPTQAEAEGTTLARGTPRHALTDFFFGKGGPVVVHVRRLSDDLTATVRPALSILAAAVSLVLLIACANVAGLLLSRGVARQRELAIRAAIGGTPARLVRQLLTESAVLSIGGGVVGLLLAWWLVRLLPALAPPRLPRLDDIRIDAAELGCAALATIIATLASGLVPAVRGARLELYEVFRNGDDGPGTGFRGSRARRFRDGLLVVEAAFAVILIVGAGLLTHSFIRLIRVDAGYSADHVLTARVEMPRDASEERTDLWIDTALARLRGLPGVASAGAGAMIPLMSRTAVMPFTLPDRVSGGKPTSGRARVYWVTRGYAEALGLRLREGRFFEDADARAGRLAMIVNEEFVRQHLSNPQATGLILPNLSGQKDGITTEIIGVVGNVLKDGNDQQPQPELYFVHGSPGIRIAGQVHLVVRTTGDAMALSAGLRQLLREIDRDAVVDHVEPLTTTVAASVDQPRFVTIVLSTFAALAVALASLGLYGVLSYGVAQRRRELGVRAALGARRIDLVWLLLREGLSVTLVGVVLGLVAAVGLARVMGALLFGISPVDPAAFTLGPALVLAVATAACLLPALRAASTDPATALRL
jgi:putative ABC transport system permease protein